MKILKAFFEQKIRNRRAGAFVIGLFAVFYVLSALAVVSVDTVPLTVANTVPGNLVLVPSVEWPTVVTHANDPGLGDGSSGFSGYSAAAVTSCPNGYTQSGNNCTQTVAAAASCASGYSLVGSSCQLQVAATAGCPSGYSFNADSSACTKVVAVVASCALGAPTNGTCGTVPVDQDTDYSCPTNYSLLSGTTTCSRKTNSCSNSPQSGYTGYASVTVSGTKYCRGPAKAGTTTYSCPTGSTPKSGTSGAGTICNVTAGPTYACPSGSSTTGGSGANTICTATVNLTYSCPGGGSLSGSGSGSVCTTTATPSYSCSAGTLSGTNCTITTPVTTQYSPYVGYFNPSLCYAYHYDDTEANRYFYPVSATTVDSGSSNSYSCSGQTGGTPSQRLWSGNFLNWASMQAIDTFRLALTGGYRVNRPEDGTPPAVSITGADGNAVTKATGDLASVTYLEKATSDRWTSAYTKSRSLPSAYAGQATPTQASLSGSNVFRTRVGGLRNQMWFMPYSTSTSDLGSAGNCCTAQNAIDLPVSDTTQTESTRQPSGVTRNTQVAIPYNPAYDTLPNTSTSSNTNSTPCGTSPIEYGCSITAWSCPNGGTADSSGNCSAQTSVTACTGSTYPYYRSSDAQCHKTNADTTGTNRSTSNLAGVCTIAGATISNANSGTANKTTCSLSAYAGTPTTYAHPGKDLIYAVSMRVRVCDTLDSRDMCTPYGSYYKPEGLLQKNATKTRYSLFSYLTENDSNGKRVGGVMRARQKLIGPVISGEQPYPERTGRYAGIDNPEWDPATGVFINDPDSTDSAATTAKIGSCSTTATPDGSGCAVKYSGVINYVNRFGELGTGLGSASTTYTNDPLSTLKAYDNLSEMYYSALSYLRGLGNSSTASNLSSTSGLTNGATFYYQNADGFPVIDDWYQNGANNPVTKWSSTTPPLTTGKPADPILYSCQTSAVLGIGDTNTNSESNTYSSDTSSTKGTSSGPFTTSVLSSWLGYLEGTSSTRMNIAALAYWAHLNDLRTDVPNTDLATSKRGQTISTYWVDVVEQGDYKSKTTNQYYNATKYGGFTVPASAWDNNGNATQWDGSTVPSLNWFTTNQLSWTTQTSNSPGGYLQPSNMYFANNGANMISGLNAAFTKIQADASGSGASLAANSTQLNTGTTTFQARYFSSVWAGDLTAYAVNLNGSINTASLWSAAALLPTTATAAAGRVIKTSTDGTSGSMVDFKTTLPAGLRTANLGATTAAQNTVINYLRGDPSVSTFRSRTTALGDIVDSQPVYVGASDPNIFYGKTFTGTASYANFASQTLSRKKRVWIAANDGMLHSFNAECAINQNKNGCATATPAAGAETFAYIPKAVVTSTPIKNLTDPQYGGSTVPHQYFNDGELTVADVYSTDSAFPTTSTNWHTVLVGSTGRGAAKAVYALDVTDPDSPTLLWERSAGDGKAGSNYIGAMIGKPIVAQTADGSWSVLVGNGYNSSKKFAALLQFAITDGTLSVHTTDESAAGVDNGLAAPAVWIANSANGVSTEAYAGDLHGTVWHFDLSGTSGDVVFNATDSSSAPQPITAGMLIGRDPATGKVWLFFGTGRYLTQTDLRDKSVQTWYGIIIEGPNQVSSSSTRSSLVARTIAAQVDATSTTIAARAITTPTDGDIDDKSGWYLDLKYGTAQGERMVTPNQFQGSLLLGTTRIPTSADPCNPSGSGFVMVINPFTGAPPGSSFFDLNSNGTVGTDDRFTKDGVTYVAAGIGFDHAPNNPIFVGNAMLLSFDDASTKSYNTAGTIGILKRLTWRELVNQ